MNGKFIAYYRVSTAQQGKSGLGLEAQQSAVKGYLNGGNGEFLGEFTEVESGKRKDRPQLNAALAMCKKLKATLIIAKLERLARNLHFISGLMEAHINFVAVDMPTANRLTVHILAAVAEEEARAISARTKVALASAKDRGVRLGTYASVLSVRNSQEAVTRAHDLKNTVSSLHAAGFVTVRSLACELNKQGIRTAQNRKWHPTTVHRMLKRLQTQSVL
ncbi:MAG: recombinase family protein [Prosthecobacter sp.]|nr:recombinase family protein [Prosthecobacter sp.]